MSLNTPRSSNILYEDFEKYIITLQNNSQGTIAHTKSFFDDEKEFMDYLHNTHIHWKKVNERVNREYKNKFNNTSKNKTKINRKKWDIAKYEADQYLISSMKGKSLSKFEYYNPDLIKSSFALYLNYLKTLKKTKITPQIDEKSENTSAKVLTTLSWENYAARHRANARIIDWNVYTPYTTPEEIENKEKREEERNKNISFDSNKKEIKIPIKKDELWQLYMDFFAEEADPDK